MPMSQSHCGIFDRFASGEQRHSAEMHMVEREWTPASNCFFDAFRNYDEAGYPRRIQCLKCVRSPTCHSPQCRC